MAEQPWFKFYATDFLLDPDVDALPLEAQAILLRMWCLCNIDGFCPLDPEEIARKARLALQAVTKHSELLLPFFEVRDGRRLYSRRMEEEKRKSESARQGGEARGKQLRSANRSADGSATCSTQSQSQNQNQSQSQNQHTPPLSQNPVSHSKEKKQCSQSDFDERDRRRVAEATQRVNLQLQASLGSGRQISDKEYFEWICEEAGVSVERGLYLKESGKEWPQSITMGATA